MIAVAVTAVALLAIAIPFVWQPHVDAEPAAASTPGASNDPVAAASHEADPTSAACMANAKQANWDFKLKDVDGKERVAVVIQGQSRAAELLGDVVRAVQG